MELGRPNMNTGSKYAVIGGIVAAAIIIGVVALFLSSYQRKEVSYFLAHTETKYDQ